MWSCGQLPGMRTNVKLVADAIAARQSSQLQGAFFVSCRTHEQCDVTSMDKECKEAFQTTF